MISILITSTFISSYPKSLLTISIGIAMIIFSIQSLFGLKIPVKDTYFWHVSFGMFSGILGGISTGQDILVSIVLKPTSSLRLPIESLNSHGVLEEIITKGRHDPCVGIRATPIAEAMLALTLMDHSLRHRGQNQ